MKYYKETRINNRIKIKKKAKIHTHTHTHTHTHSARARTCPRQILEKKGNNRLLHMCILLFPLKEADDTRLRFSSLNYIDFHDILNN
jgi:hypothetical protein